MSIRSFSVALALALCADAAAAPSGAPQATADASTQDLLDRLSDQQKEINKDPAALLGDPAELQRILHPNLSPTARAQAEAAAQSARPASQVRGKSQAQQVREQIDGAPCVVEVFASLKWIEDNLPALDADAAAIKSRPVPCKTFAYVRGLPPHARHIEDLLHWFVRLEKRLPSGQRSFSLVLDPGAFRRRKVETYPVAFARDRGREARAAGSGSPVYMLDRLDEGQAGDLGQVGETSPIPERDLIADLQDRMRGIDWKGRKEAGTARFWARLQQFDLPAATQTASRLVDMTYRTSRDVVDGKGNLVFPAGTTVNASAAVPMRLALCILDPRQPGQIQFARAFARQASAAGLRTKYIVTHFRDDPRLDWERLQDLLHEPVYLLTPQIVERFGVTATPAVVVADRSQVLVTQVAVEGSRLPDPNLALPGYDRGAPVSVSDNRDVLSKLMAPLAWLAEAVSTDAHADGVVCPNADIFGAGLMSDVCWECIFPIVIFQVPLGGGSMPYERYQGSPICYCASETYFGGFGITLSMWQPSNIIELVRHAYCSPTLDGVTLQQGVRLSGGEYTNVAQTKSHGRGAFYNYHMFAFPLLALLDLFVDERCGMGYTDFDLTYISEIDPTWNDDELADMLNPESVLFTNPVAEAACLADSAAALVGEPIGALFWCAGTWGFIYPFTGNDEHPGSIPRDTSLLAFRAIAALHRRGLMDLTMTGSALCSPQPALIIPKGQYKLSTMYPIPEVDFNHWGGESSFEWGEWRSYAGPGEDFVYLVWRWRDCCNTIENE